MKDFPPVPNVTDAPDRLFEEGHLWLLEKVDGAGFRFQLQQSGLLRFGDRNRVYDDPDAVPEPYQHAVRHVRENLDRNALRSAVDDVEDIVFFGEAMHHHRISYDWGRTPSVLGVDVWSADAGKFRPPDAAEAIFKGIGLEPVNVFERECRARDFDPDSYTVPQSNWYDGPAEGVVVRNKRGQRAKILHPERRERNGPEPITGSAEEAATAYATRGRFRNLVTRLEEQGRPVTFEPLYERVLEDITREAHARLHHSQSDVEMGDFRSEVAALTREFLDERTDGAAA